MSVLKRITMIGCLQLVALVALTAYALLTYAEAKQPFWWWISLMAPALCFILLSKVHPNVVRLLIVVAIGAAFLSQREKLTPIAYIGAIGLAAAHGAAFLYMAEMHKRSFRELEVEAATD